MDYKELLYKSIESDKYYTNTDLRMNRNYNYILNNKELDELHYLKKIIINKNIKWFNYKKFIEFEAIDITKQGALKILNKFVDRNFLISKTNSKNEKVFMLNDNILKYEVK